MSEIAPHLFSFAALLCTLLWAKFTIESLQKALAEALGEIERLQGTPKRRTSTLPIPVRGEAKPLPPPIHRAYAIRDATACTKLGTILQVDGEILKVIKLDKHPRGMRVFMWPAAEEYDESYPATHIYDLRDLATRAMILEYPEELNHGHSRHLPEAAESGIGRIGEADSAPLVEIRSSSGDWRLPV